MISIKIYDGSRDVTAHKIRKVLRYLKNHRIPTLITYVYSDSVLREQIREHKGIITDYSVGVIDVCDYQEFAIKCTFDNGDIMEEHVTNRWKTDRCDSNEIFSSRVCNSGPYCYFTIQRLDRQKEKPPVKI